MAIGDDHRGFCHTSALASAEAMVTPVECTCSAVDLSGDYADPAVRSAIPDRATILVGALAGVSPEPKLVVYACSLVWLLVFVAVVTVIRNWWVINIGG